MEINNFKALGISYKNTPLNIREAVTFDESSTKRFLAQLKEVLSIDEALVLSTCNRTEVYYLSPQDLDHKIAALIDVFHGTLDEPAAGYFRSFGHDEAIVHLYEVALGIDSMILGDIQITNQVKKAYQWSTDESMAGPFLHRLLHTIFYTNKQVVQETPFRDGTASLASAAVEIAQQFILHYSVPMIAIVGLGDIGGNIAENMKGIDAQMILINRTFEKAQFLAEKYGFKAAPMEDLEAIIQCAHVVISAVQTEEPIITGAEIRSDSPKLIIDLGVPRNIEEAVQHLPGILLYNVDQLQQKATEALERRKKAILQVRSIIDASITEFNNWSQEMEVSPVIKKFKETLEEIRMQEMARYVGKLGENELKLLDKASKNMIQKVIKLPVLQLKAACKRGEAESLVGVLNDLFNLERGETKSAR